MEEYKDISRGLKMLLDKAEEMGWNWETYIEPGSRRTYVEIGQSSPAGEDFSMTIDFDEENQACLLYTSEHHGSKRHCRSYAAGMQKQQYRILPGA